MYRERLERLHKTMDDRGIDMLVVSSPENMFYLTGYDGWSFYLHQCLIVSRRDPQLLWIGRGSDLAVAKSCPEIGRDCAFVYPDAYLHSDMRHPYDFVSETLRSVGLDTGRLALPFDAYHFTPAAYFALQKGLPGCDIVSDEQVLNWQRVRKSQAEIGFMREAARIGAEAVLAGVKAVQPGSPISITAGEILRAQTGGTMGADGGYPAIMPLLINGNGPARPHETWSIEPHAESGPFIIEIAGVHKRYHAPMARTAFIGAPSSIHLQALEAQIECMDRIEKIVRPGAVAGDIADDLASILLSHGFTKGGRFGYSTGIAYPPDWGEHTLSIRTGDDALIEEGMTLFFIPGIWGNEWSVVIGETFVVGRDGARRIGDLPFRI